MKLEPPCSPETRLNLIVESAQEHHLLFNHSQARIRIASLLDRIKPNRQTWPKEYAIHAGKLGGMLTRLSETFQSPQTPVAVGDLAHALIDQMQEYIGAEAASDGLSSAQQGRINAMGRIATDPRHAGADFYTTRESPRPWRPS